ncbi:MAG: hypothetical protein MUD02_02410 [Bacteroidales bacterium]|jgi:hypothetical protein|nr:hypothetical protein [Bacteroidales bacterium]
MKPGTCILSALVLFCLQGCSTEAPIDRHALVTRHNITHSSRDSLSSLSVGNGKFAFTADITGLQSFPAEYEKGVPLGTMAEWGWHTDKNPAAYCLEDVLKTYDVHGRQVPYVHQYRKGEEERKVAASDWLRGNPHRVNLGFIGLSLLYKDGTEADISCIENPVQQLDLWSGELRSTFLCDGKRVTVRTFCHPDSDMITASVSSALIPENRLRIKISFPSAIAAWSGYDMKSPLIHTTELVSDRGRTAIFKRSQDSDAYYLSLLKGDAAIEKSGSHEYFIVPPAGDTVFYFSCLYTKNSPSSEPLPFSNTEAASSAGWQDFWTTGGAVDFSGCTDPRAFELERRVVLSRYLTRIQCSGSLPAAETGLTYNSWFGKSHLEMHWWHAVHFALWRKGEVLERQMEYYRQIFPAAAGTAVRQGYRGVRWPKMVGPDGRESPSTVGTYLIWQQPHAVFFAELIYINSANKREVLDNYSDLVFATSDFMASYAFYDSERDRYVLGPVLIPAQESLPKETTINPPFELVYWHWALITANEWRKRLGMDPDTAWQDVAMKISKLPVRNGLYLCSETTPDSYSNQRYMSDHPIVSGILGVLPPTRLVDSGILQNSLDTITARWNWNTTWGWDFPMLAMAAAATGRVEDAVDFLLMDAPKNRYLTSGHNYQDARLSIYLPGNGGLLTAVAKMCVEKQFPANGKWNVKWEDLNKYPE